MKAVRGPPLDQSRELRNAFGCFPTGVALATCVGAAGQAVAVTVNSFSSVSLAPPLVSFALGQTARCLAAFLAAPRFAIHVLRFDQASVATRFARPTGALWEGIGHHVTPSGHIVLDESAAAFLCERVDMHEIGDHTLLIGAASRFSWDANAVPLAFCHGCYGSLDLIRPSRSSSDEYGRPSGQLAWG